MLVFLLGYIKTSYDEYKFQIENNKELTHFCEIFKYDSDCTCSEFKNIPIHDENSSFIKELKNYEFFEMGDGGMIMLHGDNIGSTNITNKNNNKLTQLNSSEVINWFKSLNQTICINSTPKKTMKTFFRFLMKN